MADFDDNSLDEPMKAVFGDPNGLGAQLSEKAGDYVLNKTGSPMLAAATKTAGDVAPMILGGMHGAPEIAPHEFVSPLKDLPSSSTGPNLGIVKLAKQYMAEKGLTGESPTNYVKANPERGARIANEFEKMKSDPNDPSVRKSYQSLADETLDQYKWLKNKAGLKVTPIEAGQENPYKTSSDAINDITKNKHLYFYPTEQGFGSINKSSNHPLLAETNEKVNGKPLLANDVFRIVHDVFGHAKEGVGFGANGEENAWRNHMPMYSPEAQKALTTETRGQNSWVNFGPYGEKNRANPANTTYADQKTGILPDWTRREGFAGGGEVPEGAIPVEQESGPPEGSIPVDQDQQPQAPEQPQPQPLSGTQKAIGIAEAVGRGVLPFGLASAAETHLGVPAEDIKAREAGLDPATAIGAESAGVIGSMFIPGVGEGWLASKAAQIAIPIAKEASGIAKVGRLALRGAFEMGQFATNDEMSDAFLDKGHDAMAVATHVATAGAIGLLTGGAFGTGGKALEKIQSLKLGEYLDNVAIGLGAASEGPERVASLRQMHADYGIPIPKGIEHGIKIQNGLAEHAAGKVVGLAAGALGSLAGATGIPGAEAAGSTAGFLLANKYLAPTADKLASKYTSIATKNVAVPVMLQAIKLGEHADIANVLGYANKSAKGAKLVSNAVEDLFNIGGKEALEANPIDNDKLHKYIENGGINQQLDEIKHEQTQDSAPQGFAEGGQVQAKPLESKGGLASLYPAQNQMLTATKGRVSQYLNSLRPQQPSKMMFDKGYHDKAAERTYRSALSIANAPVSVLTHVKNGTLLPEHLQHLASMYPELHDHMSKKITEKLVKHQHDEEKQPSYKTQQALSLFLGAHLTSSLSPDSIQAAQATFAPKQPPQQQPPTKNKKSTNSLSKVSKDYETPEQSRAARANKD